MFLLATVDARHSIAQTPEPSTFPDMTELSGLEQAVVRTWGLDFAAIVAATPDYQPRILRDDLTLLIGHALEFESAGDAGRAFARFEASIASELGTMAIGPNDTIVKGTIEGLGDQAAIATLSTVTEEYVATVPSIVVQDSQYIFLTMAIANSEETAHPARELADWLVNHGAPGGQPVVFDATGRSSGGLWEMFPNRANRLLEGLVPASDEVLFPIASDTMG
jgi:hypothetical protein